MNDLLEEARSRVDTVDPADVYEATGGEDIVLDVREPSELESDGAIDGAVHVPRGMLEMQADPDTGKSNARLTGLRGSEGRVHVLCASGARAAMAADTLRVMGYRATVIEGGLEGWKKAGLPVAG
ncbi:sulfurtransferase [Palleronia sediminis]|uniref:Sulfurtransferase n=2 Tax=Palleronia sediminis TaxID=2547833 RepID=A0A4R6AAR0_9RHOB|nr:sulfurtransferase [Palleronia sediminis]